MTVLSISGLDAVYGGVPVVRGLNLEVSAGEVVALLGPNGAGKTTTLRTISGLLPAIAGAVTVDRRPTDSRRPFRVARRGIAHVADQVRVRDARQQQTTGASPCALRQTRELRDAAGPHRSASDSSESDKPERTQAPSPSGGPGHTHLSKPPFHVALAPSGHHGHAQGAAPRGHLEREKTRRRAWRKSR